MICHATGADGKWVTNEPAKSGDLNGHVGHQDGRDIIPPFSYEEDGQMVEFPGQNWDEAGQAVYNNGCKSPGTPDTEFLTPTVELAVEQCVAADGEVPAVMTANLGALTAGESYRVSVSMDGGVPTLLPLVEATAATAVVEIPLSGEGEYVVTVSRVGAEEDEGVGSESVTVTPCPDPPAPEIRIVVDQCLAAGGTVPEQFEVFFDDTLAGENYSLQVSKDGISWPVRTVLGTGDEGSVLIDTAGPGEYQVTLSYGETSAQATVEVEPCPEADFDLALAKSATTADGAAEVGDLIRYTLTVTGSGSNSALNPTVTDTLPAGLVFAGGVSASDGWEVSGAETVTASFAGAFTGEASIEFDAMVTVAPASGEVVNTACVSSDGAAPEVEPGLQLAGVGDVGTFETVGEEEPDGDSTSDTNPGNDCGQAETPVRSVGVTGAAACVNDTPWFTYSVTPAGISDPGSLPISIIWWSPEAYAARDASIPAADHAAILADGAAQVDTLAYPAGWQSGDTLSGEVLWPGASVDAAGNPTGWPGWSQRADGTWFEDPAAPFYNLRGETVVEIRINPTAAATTVYPPATPDCNARPPITEPPSVVPAVQPGAKPVAPGAAPAAPAARPVLIAETGSTGLGTLGAIAIGLFAAGAGLSLLHRRPGMRKGVK
ncbi:DUF11 domain-containing protein [Leucobacter aridicollis]|uniref:DUF11 domain-containing protein n=1 Tax=Leucobacter aridicollis TaxID=283878 RepID=UPI0021043A76|nr:DUF11 domain-containing protein [Leucobacter aridicollis]UTX52264.1 DUF11 domain-containing protein [Leucobacter aridicollis]